MSHTMLEKLAWMKVHTKAVRTDALKNNLRDTLAMEAHISAVAAMEEALERNGEAPLPLPCNGCIYNGKNVYYACNTCCRGKRDILAESRAQAYKKSEERDKNA